MVTGGLLKSCLERTLSGNIKEARIEENVS